MTQNLKVIGSHRGSEAQATVYKVIGTKEKLVKITYSKPTTPTPSRQVSSKDLAIRILMAWKSPYSPQILNYEETPKDNDWTEVTVTEKYYESSPALLDLSLLHGLCWNPEFYRLIGIPSTASHKEFAHHLLEYRYNFVRILRGEKLENLFHPATYREYERVLNDYWALEVLEETLEGQYELVNFARQLLFTDPQFSSIQLAPQHSICTDLHGLNVLRDVKSKHLVLLDTLRISAKFIGQQSREEGQ